jgi:hypothetical protein
VVARPRSRPVPAPRRCRRCHQTRRGGPDHSLPVPPCPMAGRAAPAPR